MATFCNAYPDVNIVYDIPNEVVSGEEVVVQVTVSREVDEDDDDEDSTSIGTVQAPKYPLVKKEQWWVVIGDAKNNALLSIKRVGLDKTAKVALEVTAPSLPGTYTYQLYLICDSYVGCDLENEITLTVA